MRSEAAVVVVGGGIIGCSIAYHLAAAGCRDVVLVEKGELTSGTTFHSVGLVSQFRTSPADMRLMNYSIRLYREIAAEVGEAAGWRPVGSLRLASSAPMLQSLQRSVSRARALGLDVGIITPAEALRICPVMSGAGLHGAVHVPDDGYLEPNGITRELARRAAARGAEVVTGTRVTGIRLDPRGRVRGSRDHRGRDPRGARRQRRRPVGASRGGDGRGRPADRPPDAPVPHHAARPRPGASPRNPGGARSREPRVRARGGGRIPGRRVRAPPEGVAPRRRAVGVHAAAAPRRVGAVRAAPGGGHPPIPGRREGRDPAAGQRARRLHAGRSLRARPGARTAGPLGGGGDVDQRDRRGGGRRAA